MRMVNLGVCLAVGLSAFAATRDEIVADIAAMEKRVLADQTTLSDVCSLTDYRARVRTVAGDEVWTDALQAALDEHAVVRIPEGRYLMDGTVRVKSNRRLEAGRARIVMRKPMDTSFLVNEHAATSAEGPVDVSVRDVNIAIVGGVWEDWRRTRMSEGASGKGGFEGASALFYFSNAKGLSFRDVTLVEAGSFGIQVGDAEDVVCENLSLENCHADGFHVNGGVKNVLARNIHGDIGDDLVALNFHDWPCSSANFGPGDTVLVENLRLRKGPPWFRLLPGVKLRKDGTKHDCPARNIVVRDVKGVNEFKMYMQTRAYQVGTRHDPAEVGHGENIWFEDLDIVCNPKQPPFEIGANLSGVHLRNLRVTFPKGSAHRSLVRIGPKSERVTYNEMPYEIFDPWVSCMVKDLEIADIDYRNGPPAKEVDCVVFDDVLKDGDSSGRGVLISSTARAPVYALDALTPATTEVKLAKPFSAKAGGIQFWARNTGAKGGDVFSFLRDGKTVLKARFTGPTGGDMTFDVVRTDGRKNLFYNRKTSEEPGDWALVTLTWDETHASKYFINTLPYVVCFLPGQRMPDFEAADVDGIDTLCFAEARKRAFEIRGLRVFDRPITNREVWDAYRAKVPVDMVMHETVVPADEPTEVAIQLGPAGYYTRPAPIRLDGFKPAGAVGFELTVKDKIGKILATNRQTVDVNGPVELTFPARAYPKGQYTIEAKVNGFYTRTWRFVSFTSDYKPEYSAADRERGEMIYERIVKVDDPDILKQGKPAMRTSPAGTYLECGSDVMDRIEFEIPFPADVSGKPVELEIEWPDDKPRFAGFHMYGPFGACRDYLQQAISSGYEIPQSDKMQKSTFLFFPGSTNYLFEARTLAAKMPAAVKAVRIYRVKAGKLPANRIVTPKGMPGRTFGFFDEDQTFMNNLNAQAMHWSAPCRMRYEANYPDETTWMTDEYYRYFDYIGMNTISEPVWRYWVTYFPSEGQVGGGLWPSRSLGWVLKEFPKHGQRFIASLNYSNLPDMKFAAQIDGDFLKRGMVTADKSGKVGSLRAGERSTANPCHPECVRLFLDYLRDPVARYAESGLSGVQYEITSWGTWGNLNNGYDDYTVGKFAKDTGIAVTGKPEDRYAFLTGEKCADWLAWRAEQVTALVRAMRRMLDDINPALDLELIVPADKEERYVQRGIDVAAIKKLPNVRFCVTRDPTNARIDMHWSRPESTLNEDLYDFAKADAEDLAVNGAIASVRSYYGYLETFVGPLKPKPYNCYFQNADAKPWGRHFLREAAFALAAYDMLEYTAGAQPVPSVGHESEVREFARAYRFLPAKPFKDVGGVRDPALARYLPTENGTYWYVVNVFHEPVVVSLDLGDGKRTELALNAYEVMSGLVEGKTVEVKDLAFVRIDPAADAFYDKRFAQLDAAIAALEKAGVEVPDEKACRAKLTVLRAESRWAELYRVAYSRLMNQLVTKCGNIPHLLAEQAMAKKGAWRVNCGSSAYWTAPDGALFLPDVPFNGRYGYTDEIHQRCSRDVTDITGTDLVEVYKTEAYQIGHYRFKVPGGTYRVTVYLKCGFARGFAEGWQMSIDVNGKALCKDFDLYNEQKGVFGQALKLTTEVEAKDGEIVLAWSPSGTCDPTSTLANAIVVEPCE